MLADGRPRLRRGRSARRRPAVRRPGRVRPLIADGPRAGHGVTDGPGAQPPARSTRGSRRRWPPARAPPRGTATSSATAAARTGSSRRTTGCRCSAARRGPGSSSRTATGSGTCTCSTPEQPDLNWDNPEVVADLEKTLRFWLDRGVDGFRIDVAHGMAKPPGLPDMEPTETAGAARRHGRRPAVRPRRRARRSTAHPRGARRVPRRGGRRRGVGVRRRAAVAEYLRADELHLGFNFRLLRADFDAADLRDAVENSLAAAAIADATPTWCCPTTTSTATSPATAAATSACAGRGRWRW